ncbi:hypothetical protein [Phycicoccus sp.]|uniref:hypothetical protein n=1 Tax=Phycicoccus sp. TaxID=1902410 RepID=UPI002C672CEA|nr:hypothetical protein [Phycicoccus sp.]HMM95367.1 hypothetical protein [Phycicoccus sp.]
MSDIVHVNPDGRRLFTATVGAQPIVFQAATEQEVQDWLIAQLGAPAKLVPVRDVGHADRTEVTQWGLTDRV